MLILMTTHGTADDEIALRFGAAIAKHIAAPPTVLSVIPDEADRPRADEHLARAREILKPDVLDVETKVRVGSPAQEIIREAEEGEYDLVIVGERRNPNLLSRFLTGSTTIRVVEHAPCAVIIAKGEIGPIKRILLCDSGAHTLSGGVTKPSVSSSLGAQAMPSLLGRLTGQLTSLLEGEEEITVLHVMSQISAGPGVRGVQLRAEVDQLIQEGSPEGRLFVRGVETLQRPGIRVYPKVRHGLVVDEILVEARQGDYDLVVIGAHRGEGWQRILLDDLAHRLVVQLDRPVLVVR